MWLQQQTAPQQQLSRSLHAWRAPPTAARRWALAARRHRRPAAQSVTAPVSDIDVNQLYQDKVQLAGSSVGPVKPIRVVGQGRGLQTTRSVSPGDTLLVSSPLCLTRRSQQEAEETGQDLSAAPYLLTDEDVEELLQQLERAPSNAALDAQEAWLAQLDDGTPDRQKVLPDVTSLASNAAAAGLRGQPRGDGSHAASWSQDMGSGEEGDKALSHVLDIVDINAIAELEDPCVRLQSDPSSAAAAMDPEAASSSSSGRPQVLLGLWPEAALLNHSCVPNTVVVPVQGHLVLRAVRPVAKEGQLTRSYLGPLAWAPLAVRQAALQDTWGVTCTCARCKEEAKLDSNMQQLISDTYQAVTEELAPDLAQAFAAGDAAGVSQVCEQVALAAEVLDAAFNKLGLKQQTQLWVQVSLFRLYELAAAASSVESGETDPRMLELLTALAAEGGPGSQAHVQLAAQYLAEVSADEEAPFTGALNYAEDLVLEAFRLRYGSQLTRSTFRTQLAALVAAGELEEGEA